MTRVEQREQEIAKLTPDEFAHIRDWLLEQDAAADKLDELMKQTLADLRYRRFGTGVDDGVLWVWIGTHAEYNRLV